MPEKDAVLESVYQENKQNVSSLHCIENDHNNDVQQQHEQHRSININTLLIITLHVVTFVGIGLV